MRLRGSGDGFAAWFIGDFLLSPRVLAAIGHKHVQHFGIFKSYCPMLDIALHDNTVAAAQFCSLTVGLEHYAPAHDINKLLMRMPVTCSFPPF